MKFDEGKIVIELELGNDAMSHPADVSGVLLDVARAIASLGDHETTPGNYDGGAVRRKFRDVNGNTVAFWRHEPS